MAALGACAPPAAAGPARATLGDVVPCAGERLREESVGLYLLPERQARVIHFLSLSGRGTECLSAAWHGVQVSWVGVHSNGKRKLGLVV